MTDTDNVVRFPANDPLAGLTKKQIWFDCVWHSDESTSMKLFLLCIGRYFDEEGGSSSMSLAQIQTDCRIGIDTAKRHAKRARDHWLSIEVQKGFMTRYGRQNLYHAVLPPLVLAGLRELRTRQLLIAQQDRKGGAPYTPLGGGTIPPLTQIHTPTEKITRETVTKGEGRRGRAAAKADLSAGCPIDRAWGAQP